MSQTENNKNDNPAADSPAESVKHAKAGVFYFVGNVFDKAIAFVTIPIFTRLLSTTEYGIVSTYASWVTILSVVLGLSLANSVRTACVDFENDLDGYVSSITFLSLISGLVLSIPVCVAGSYSLDVFEGDNLWPYCVAQAITSSIIAVVQATLLMRVSYVKRTLLSSLPNLLAVILSIVFILQLESSRHYGRVWASVIIYVIVGIVLLVIVFSKGKKFVVWQYWRYALSFSLPVILHSLSVVVLAQSDRVMITALRNASETGVYSLVYSLGMLATVFSTTFENMWIPWFTQKIKNGDKQAINRYAFPYYFAVALVCCGLMLIGPELLKLLAPESYWGGATLIAPITLASFFMFLASLCIDLEYYLKKTKSIALNTVIAAAINIGLNIVFVPSYGAIAAAYTTAASYLVSTVLHYLYSKKLDCELFPLKTLMIPACFVALSAAISLLLIDQVVARFVLCAIVVVAFFALALRIWGVFRR